MKRIRVSIVVVSLVMAPLAAQESRPAPSPAAATAALTRLAAAAPAERSAALRQLGGMSASAAVLQGVALALGDADSGVRHTAVDTLLLLRPALVRVQKELHEVVTVRDSGRWQVARMAFARANVRLLPVGDAERHQQRLGSIDPSERRKAVLAICKNGDAAAQYEADLLALLADPDEGVRAAVTHNIGAIGPRKGLTDKALAALVVAIKDPVAAVRHGAAETLGRSAGEPAVVAALRGAVQDPDVDVRTQVLRSLRKGGAAAAAAAGDVVASLRDREEKVRVAALEAIRVPELRTKRAAGQAIRLLGDKDHKVLAAALETVATFGKAAAAALPTVLGHASHPKKEVRRRALEAAWAVAGESKNGAVVLATADALLDEERDVQKKARELLQAFVDRAGSEDR